MFDILRLNRSSDEPFCTIGILLWNYFKMGAEGLHFEYFLESNLIHGNVFKYNPKQKRYENSFIKRFTCVLDF